MSERGFTESVVEDAALAWLESLGYTVKHGPDITPGGDTLTLTPSTSLRTGLSQWELSMGKDLRCGSPLSLFGLFVSHLSVLSGTL